MTADFRDVDLGGLEATLEERADGSMLVRAAKPLGSFADKITDALDHWAKATPDAVFLAQRDASGDWRRLTYRETRAHVRRIGSALLARGLLPEQPVAILSGNDIEQALLGLAAMYVGVPFSPISPAYSLISTDYEKLRTILGKLTPGMIYATKGDAFAKALAASCDPSIEFVARFGAASDRATTSFSSLLETNELPVLDEANQKVGPDTIAKILFTSGSTGQPKGVINTQRMLCSNQAMLAHWLAFGVKTPPVLVDWLPWNHTFGGNHNFNYALVNGGSLYIDGGKPTPAGIEETVRNLREISPSVYFNVPKGYEELALRLRKDQQLRESFFKNLQLTFYAGAGLPPHVAQELDDLARATVGRRILMVTSLGSTETAPASLASTKECSRPGVVGVPLPGVEMKLLPSSGKLEVRVKGPNIMPGYWRDEEQTAKVFDEEGFYCLGDALKFAHDKDPNGGFIFDGRISEDFKLVTGTWVSVGPLRGKLISALAPFIKDAVIAGHDRDDVMALLFPEMDSCRAFIGDASKAASDDAVLSAPALREEIGKRLSQLARESTGSSTRVARVVLLGEPASIDANEITDKGSINQRAVLTRRAALVESLYEANPPANAICA